MKFEVIVDSYLTNVQYTVTERLKKGWELAGSMFKDDQYFYQPMVKYPD